MSEYGYVYIMASTFKRLYIGVTSELAVRVQKHKQHLYPESFTARYKIDRLGVLRAVWLDGRSHRTRDAVVEVVAA
jgi:predicted GIY-YIG superfamily endonuclease